MQTKKQNISFVQNLGDDIGDFNANSEFINYFGTTPNSILITLTNKTKLENYIKNNKPTKTISSFDRESNSKSFYEDRSLLIYDQGFAILIYSRNGSKPSSYILFTEEAKTEALNIAKSIAKVTINKKQKDSAFINLISLNNRGELDLLKYEINKVQLDLALNYGEEFIKKYEKIINRLSTDNDKGVVLFHGEPGTGKTTLIRKLLYDLKDKKRIIYLPSDISSRLSEPGFMSFIMKYPNSILLIEDAEMAIKKREGGEKSAIHNILNMTDGLLADCLSIQVICTFNTKLEDIDEALLRDGRLIARHEFGLLSNNQILQIANKEQLKILNSEIEPMTIAKLYSYKNAN